MPPLGIAIKCEVFMVTGCIQGNHKTAPESSHVYIHTVWSLYPGANTMTSPEYIHTNKTYRPATRPIDA